MTRLIAKTTMGLARTMTGARPSGRAHPIGGRPAKAFSGWLSEFLDSGRVRPTIGGAAPALTRGLTVLPVAFPRESLQGLLRLLRPGQSLKNLFCLAGVLFGAGRLTEVRSWLLDAFTVCVFWAASSSVYILNDMIDRDRDRAHPQKRHRPIASNEVSLTAASILAGVLATLAIAGAAALGPLVLSCVAVYSVNNVLYSLKFKHLALIDILSIALGFVLRLLAGIYALNDFPTTWITLCTFFLSVFLASCKRRAELARIVPETDQTSQRPVLSKYTVPYLDQLVNNAAAMTVMCYALFTTSSHKSPSLVITVPIVFFAVMHYKRLVMLWELGEEPERVVIRDPRLLASGVVFLLSYFAVLYGDIQLFRW